MTLSLFRPPAALLPQFRSLLVRGAFPCSSIIYLCLSHLSTSNNIEDNVVVLTPSRERLAQALKECMDTWLLEHGGDGAVAALLARVRIL
jgi:hypothetical protein